jgi:flagellin
MAVINTNTKALFSQNALKVSGKLQAKSMEQLSTGKRINTAGDDAAGLAISTRMTQQIRALNQAVRNAGDAISLIQTAEGATGEMTNMLQRMRELAIQAINDTNSNPDRSYLDLEFQQLKQEVVRISEMTEWNGFKVLDGTAGERVGEVPVYKATSVNLSGDVLINPTTLRTLSGANGGEVQTLTFTGTPATGQIRVAGHDITIGTTEAASLTAFTAAVAAALTATSDFDASSGRTVTANAGVLTFTYATADGDVDPVANTVLPGSTGVTATSATTRDAVAQVTEGFTGNAAFIKSGSLAIDVAANTAAATSVTAVFTTVDGDAITMTGTANRATGTVTFSRDAGNNRQVFSGALTGTPDTLTYSFKDSAETAEALTSRAVSLSVSVDGSIPALRSGDLRINGIDIGASYATADLLSPRSNAAGSAIAKAAAINRMAASTGISLPESQTITFAGVPRPGTIRVGGVDVTITSADTTSAAVAAKVAAALRASPLYDLNSGRNITHASGSSVVNVDFSMDDGDVGAMEFLPGTTALIGMVDVSQEFTTTAPGTGVFAKVNENIVAGRAMSASSVVSGVVRINGYASADITSVLNNTRETRARVVEAINAITQRTGVKAIDTGSDAKGITLVAQDGRNIEVTFETSANASIFGDRIGLNQGVQASTISLESKIQTPVVLTSSTTGDITRAGLIEGNFTKNQSVFNTAVRQTVEAPTAQVAAVTVTGTAAITGTYSVSINGTTFSTATAGTPQAKRDALITAINADTDLGVTATAGNAVGELRLTANVAGTSFTLTTSADSTATGSISSTEITANQEAQFKPLGVDDLVINGIEIRASRPGDDTKSSTVSQSSDRAASAIAIAAAINSHTPETGVRALANGPVSKGMQTTSSLPATGSTMYTLYVNGTAVDVEFTKDEVGVSRRTKVVDAINARMGQHGVTAKDNGYGVSLETDGRNLSVWFDSSIKGLTASEFGLEKGGSTAQVSRISVGGTVTIGQKASVVLNGQPIESTAAAATTAADLAAKLAAEIEAAITADELVTPRVLANLSVSYTAGNDFIEITSAIPGSPFDLRGASTSATGPTLTLATVTPNGQGDNDITAIRGATATSNSARTLYGTVRLISESALMPNLPSPVGAPPSDKAALVGASAKPFTVAVGDRGFGPSGNFAALGFQIGSFGGRSSESLDPPKVGRLAFQVGASANQLITIDLADFGKNGDITGSITGDVDLNVDQRTARIHTRDGANSVLQMLDEAMDKINATRASMGAVMNRLQYAMDNLSNVSMNQEASRSQIQDADYAKASTEMAKSQIMQQAATAVLAQANMSQQTVLQLLQG